MVAAAENETGAKPAKELAPISDKSLQAEASSAHSRINIPLNLDNWKSLPEEVSAELLWFHQWLLDNQIGWEEGASAINYDRSNLFRILKGTYEGSWPNIVRAVRSFRKLQERRGSIQANEFVENSITKLIFSGLDYALANRSITLIVGESRSGKSVARIAWQDQNNHGRSVGIVAPPIGGTKALVRRAAGAVGVNRSQDMAAMVDAIYRAFNPNRILIVDEAHRLLPNDSRTVNPASLEFLRDLHDQTGCALALITTRRMPERLKRGEYQYEQLIGRIGMPILIPKTIKRADLLPIAKQFVPQPSLALIDTLEKIANEPGRLGIMVETLKVASRIAHKAGEKLAEVHVRKAIAIRTQHSGEAK